MISRFLGLRVEGIGFRVMLHPVMVGYPLLRQVLGEYSGQAICFRDPL